MSSKRNPVIGIDAWEGFKKLNTIDKEGWLKANNLNIRVNRSGKYDKVSGVVKFNHKNPFTGDKLTATVDESFKDVGNLKYPCQVRLFLNENEDITPNTLFICRKARPQYFSEKYDSTHRALFLEFQKMQPNEKYRFLSKLGIDLSITYKGRYNKEKNIITLPKVQHPFLKGPLRAALKAKAVYKDNSTIRVKLKLRKGIYISKPEDVFLCESLEKREKDAVKFEERKKNREKIALLKEQQKVKNPVKNYDQKRVDILRLLMDIAREQNFEVRSCGVKWEDQCNKCGGTVRYVNDAILVITKKGDIRIDCFYCGECKMFFISGEDLNKLSDEVEKANDILYAYVSDREIIYGSRENTNDVLSDYRKKKSRERLANIKKIGRQLAGSRPIYVHRGIISCMKNRHNVISVRAEIPTAETGEFALINANYCADCDKVFISEREYMYYKEIKNLSNITFVYMDKSGNFPRCIPGFDVESVLHENGYNVNASKGLSDVERHRILIDIIETGKCRKPDVIKHLNSFIKSHSMIKGHEKAVLKWERDLEFVREYNFEQQKKIRIHRVETM